MWPMALALAGQLAGWGVRDGLRGDVGEWETDQRPSMPLLFIYTRARAFGFNAGRRKPAANLEPRYASVLLRGARCTGTKRLVTG